MVLLAENSGKSRIIYLTSKLTFLINKLDKKGDKLGEDRTPI